MYGFWVGSEWFLRNRAVYELEVVRYTQKGSVLDVTECV